MTVDEIIETLGTSELPPPDVLRAAVAHAAELGPPVCDLVGKVYRGVFLLPDAHRLLLHGLHVLAAARFPDLWPRLVELARLPEGELDDLFFGRGADSLGRMMITAWDGDVDGLLRLIQHADMPPQGKWALLDCLSRLTFDGRIAREITSAFLERLEREGFADDDDPTWYGWEQAVTRLGLVDLAPALARVWDKPVNAHLSEVDREESLEELQRVAADPSDATAFDEVALKAIDDPVEALAWVEEALLAEARMSAQDRAEYLAGILPASAADDPGAVARLAPDEEVWLGRFLVSRQAPESSMSLEMLDGFLTALAIGPVDVPQTEFLPVIWGTEDGSGPVWDSAQQQAHVMNLLARHQRAIRLRRDADAPHVPLMLPGPDAERGSEWAEGFLDAIDLADEAWDAIFKDRRAGDLAMMIVALAGDDPELFEEPLTVRQRAEILVGLPRTIGLVAAFWRDPDVGLPARQPARSVKVGRNETCPCGSGKKYKKCCGSGPPPSLH